MILARFCSGSVRMVRDFSTTTVPGAVTKMETPPMSASHQQQRPDGRTPTSPSDGDGYYGSMDPRTLAEEHKIYHSGPPNPVASPLPAQPSPHFPDDSSGETLRPRGSPPGLGPRRAHSGFRCGSAMSATLIVTGMLVLVWRKILPLNEQTLRLSQPTSSTATMTMVQLSPDNQHNSHKEDVKQANTRKKCIFTNVQCNTQENECYLRPSEYEACLQRIRLHPAHVRQTLQSLDDIFAQYYPFYYLAQNPLYSNTTSTGIPHNDRVYDRKYDLHAQLQSLQQRIDATGQASVATFWNVTAAFNWLRDAHVNAVQGRIGQLTSEFWSGRYSLVVLPTLLLHHHSDDNEQRLIQTNFYVCNGTCSDGSAVGLDLWRYRSQHRSHDTNETTNNKLRLDAVQHVTRVDGTTPWEFVLRLAQHAPLASITFKSVGPRVNALLFRNFATTSTAPMRTFFRTRPGRKERIWPSDILPHDALEVEYQERNGGMTREKFDVRIVVTLSDCMEIHDLLQQAPNNKSGKRIVVDITDIEKAANEPSCLYRNHESGMRQFNKIHPQTKNGVRQRILSHEVPQSVRHHQETEPKSIDILDKYCSCSQDGWFTKHYNCSNFAAPFDGDGPFEVAYKVMEDFVVFQIDSFDAPPRIIFPLWSEITQAAQRAGVDKLMIDISNNGGGEVPMGLNLARLLYTEVACAHFDNAYDMVYNPAMRVWARDVDPLLRQIESNGLEDSDAMNDALLTALVGDTQARQRYDIIRMTEAMCIFALDRNDNYCGADPIASVQTDCALYQAAVEFDRDPNKSTMNQFLRQYLASMRSGNPWTVPAKFGVSDDIEEKSYLRGGVLDNFTGFLLHEPDLPVWWNCSLEVVSDEDNVFSQYILVSNGNAGSTTNTFQTTVEQLWKNRNLTQARRPLTTVSYGGVEGDTPLTQFAGGTLDDRVNIQDAYAGLVGLHLLQVVCPLFADDEFMCAQVHAAFIRLRDILPQVPFYLENLPALPAVEIYNEFMLSEGEATVPLEFVFMPPDLYLQKMYSGTPETKAKNRKSPSGGLESLYYDASRFFYSEKSM